jgi:hypothetical protein
MLTGADHSPKREVWSDGTVEGSNSLASVGPDSPPHPRKITTVAPAAAVKRIDAVI